MKSAMQFMFPVIIVVCGVLWGISAYRQNQEIKRLNQECAGLQADVIEARGVATSMFIDGVALTHQNQLLKRQVNWLESKRRQ